jgi:fructokinase
MLQGGSPANVARGLARLGVPSRLLGTVGTDALGDWLRSALQADGVDTRLLWSIKGARTGLVFLSINAQGERHFLPAREGTADNLLTVRHLPAHGLAGVGWVHFSSGPLRTPAGRALIRTLRSRARQRGLPVSVDANLRPGVWPSLAANVEALWKASRGVDVLKCNLEEALALTGTRDVEQALRRMRAHARRLAVVTLGPDGACAMGEDGVVRVPARRGRVVDTTGAGDAFMAGLLQALHGQLEWSNALLRQALTRGCALGTRVCGGLGSMARFPTR